MGEEFFVLDEGQIEIIIYQDKANPKDPDLASKVIRTKILEKGVAFGEIALLYNDKRTATVKAN